MTHGDTLFIGITIALAFGLRSIFGFGGTVFALAVLALIYDIKEMVVLCSLAAITSSFLIVLSDHRSFDRARFIEIMIAAIPGLLIGAVFLKNFSSNIILYGFASLLVLYAAWTVWSPRFVVPKKMKPIVNFFGGLFGGIYGAPGPFCIAAMRETFRNKSAMRTTLSAVFFVLDVIRIPIYFRSGLYTIDAVAPYWWVLPFLFLTVWAGFKIHKSISERAFQIGVSVMLGIAGIALFLK